MSQREDFEREAAAIRAIPDSDAKTPNMPMETYHKEAEYLEKWCQRDQDAITAAGLDWQLAEDLPYRVGASREAQANWAAKRFQRKEAQERWVAESPGAYDLRDQVVHAMLYAFRNQANLLARAQTVAEGDGDADMLEDLNVLEVIARENPKPLEAIGFDAALLKSLSPVGETMAELRALASVDSDEVKELKLLRDKAYTHLKAAVDEIRACGQYLFWRDENRRKGYASQYNRQTRSKASPQVIEETEGPAPAQPQ